MLRERRAYGVKEGGSQVGRVAALMIGIGIAAIKNIPMFRGQFGTGENSARIFFRFGCVKEVRKVSKSAHPRLNQ